MRARLVTRSVTLVALVGLAAPESRAADYRRPGLEGSWSERHLTAPMNSLRILAGPGQPAFMGQRYGAEIAEGGVQYLRGAVNPDVPPGDEWWLRAGIGFGLTEDWEVGVLFLPFRFTPDFEFTSVTVAITRGFRFRHWDLGLRLSFQTPGLKAYDASAWGFNPAIPLLYRAGPFRLDVAPSLPILTRDGSVGVNVPLRATLNATVRFFFGVESGFVKPRFTAAHDAAVPLGVLIGHTELLGNKVVDFTASLTWDDCFRLSAPDGEDALALDRYRVGFGLVFHTLVR